MNLAPLVGVHEGISLYRYNTRLSLHTTRESHHANHFHNTAQISRTSRHNPFIHNEPPSMKLAAATTFFFATLALASPSPAAQPQSNNAAVAQPIAIEPSRYPTLEARKKKKPKLHNGNGNSTDQVTESAGVTNIKPLSRVLQIGALGVGVMGVVRLWP
jgi:hypothetical protein